MEIKEATIAELDERRNAIVNESEAEGADLDALEAEMRAINEEKETRKQMAEKRANIRASVADGKGEVKEKIEEEKKQMPNIDEIRSSKAYIDAFANGIKKNDDNMTECRALLSELAAGGTVPVPKMVEERIRTNWDKLGIMNLVRKTFIPGVLRVGFEKSATAATNHTESTSAITEETLTLGVVSITSTSVKKYITISDEVLDYTSEEFLNYVYDEITYQIAKKAQQNLLDAIIALTASATTTAVSVPSVTGTPSIGVIASAIGELSDDASDPVIVMNKGTWAQFKAAQYAGNFNVDPFEGLAVYYDNSLPAFTSSGTTGSAWAIVGDFGIGAIANFPGGEGVTLKYDDLSLSEKDLVKITGREFIGVGVVHCDAFAKIVF